MIPKIIHHIWVGPPMPAVLQGYVASWKRNHPDWEFRFWDDDSMFTLTNQHLYDRAEEITPENIGQFRADLARYEILYRHGGVYVDCDFESLKPIDSLLHRPLLAAWEDTGVFIGNAILGAEPEHPLLQRLIEAIPTRVEAHPGWRPNRLTGPHLLTETWRASRLGLDVQPKALFYPYLWSQLERGDDDFPAAYAVHHWNNRRTKTGVGFKQKVGA